MFLFSSGFLSLLQSFAPLFDFRVWSHAQLLLVGAMLAPGKRTVMSVLRIVRLGKRTALSELPSRVESCPLE